MAESKLIAFYRQAGTDHRGRSLAHIRGLSLEELEATHDFIQWLFPLPEPSSASEDAPLLSQADIRRFTSDQFLRAELVLSLEVMLRFFGLRLRGREGALKPEVGRAEDFAERRLIWLYAHSHNFLRITRILRALYLLGCSAQAAAFLRCLESIYAEFDDAVGARTMTYWRNAVPGFEP